MADSESAKKRRSSAKSGGRVPPRVPKGVALSILRALGRLGKAGGSPSQIAQVSKVPLRTVKRHLEYLTDSGAVHSPHYGHYEVVSKNLTIDHDPAGRLGLHDILLVGYEWPSEGTRPPEPTLPQGSFGEWQSTPGNNYLEQVKWWKDRAVGFRWWPGTRTLNVSLPADRNPLEFEEAERFMGWLEGVCYPIDPGEHLELRKIGVHRDYYKWELDGIKKVRLTAWANAYRQVYQKYEEMVRDEVHLSLHELKLKEAVELISGTSPTAQIAKAVEALAQVEEARTATVKKLEGPKTPPPEEGGYQSGYA